MNGNTRKFKPEQSSGAFGASVPRKFKPGDQIRQRWQHNAPLRTVLSWQHDDPDVVLVHCTERGPSRVISVFAWSHDLVQPTDEASF